MKRVISLILAAVMLITSIPITAVAAEENKLKFDINVDGEHVVYVEAGEEITVSFNITNMSEDSDFTITNLQNEIEYDQDFFEFTEGDVEYETATSSRLAEYSWGAKRVQILALHVSGGTAKPYENGQLVAKVTFKVKDGLADGTSGKLLNKACEAADAINEVTYSIAKSDLTVIVGKENYTVTYLDGGNIIESNDTVADGTEIEVKSALHDNSKKFAGWKAPDGEIYNPGEKYLVVEDTVFEAVWYKKCSVFFETNGGSLISEAEFYENDIFISSDYLTTKDNYIFCGWYIDEDFNTPADDNITLTDDITLYAKWIPEGYTLSFETGCDIDVSDLPVEYDEVVDLTQYELTREHYDFNGWYESEGSTTPITEIKITGDTTVYAKWTEHKKFTVSFDTDGGSTIEDVEDYIGETVDLTKYNPIREGYEFGGWVDEDGKPIIEIVLGEDVTVKAIWTAHDHTLKFITNGGTVIEDVPVKYDQTVDLTNYVTELDHFDFDGWYADEYLTQKMTDVITIKGDLTVYAKWHIGLKKSDVSKYYRILTLMDS